MPRVLLNAAMQWSVVVPVKALAGAKSRLDEAADLRAALSRAFLSDVLAALAGSTLVREVLVVCDEDPPGLRGDSRLRVHRTAGHGLNPDLQEGLAIVGAGPVAIVAGDLPCLTAASIDAILAAAAGHAHAFVSDAQGVGTTMLLGAEAGTVVPQFGARSHARHTRAGAAEIASLAALDPLLLSRARRDVDTPVDLWDAVRIGVGPATSSLLAADA